MAAQASSSLELPKWPFPDEDRPPWHEKALDILKDVVDKKADLPIFQAARRLAELMPEQEHEDIDMETRDLGDFIRAVASQLHYTSPLHIRLVSVFMYLGRYNAFTTLTGRDSETVTRSISRAWKKDLIYLEPWVAYKTTESHEYVPYPDEAKKSPEHRSACVNAAAFDARLATAGLRSGEYYDAGAMADLRQALETKPKYGKEIWRTEVLVAAIHAIFSGQLLFDNAVIGGEVYGDTHGWYNTYELYQGPAWGVERWRFWRQRFTEIALEERDLDAEVSQVSNKAANIMLAIERNYLY